MSSFSFCPSQRDFFLYFWRETQKVGSMNLSKSIPMYVDDIFWILHPFSTTSTPTVTRANLIMGMRQYALGESTTK